MLPTRARRQMAMWLRGGIASEYSASMTSSSCRRTPSCTVFGVRDNIVRLALCRSLLRPCLCASCLPVRPGPRVARRGGVDRRSARPRRLEHEKPFASAVTRRPQADAGRGNRAVRRLQRRPTSSAPTPDGKRSRPWRTHSPRGRPVVEGHGAERSLLTRRYR